MLKLKQEKWIKDDAKTVAEEVSSQVAYWRKHINIRRFEKFN